MRHTIVSIVTLIVAAGIGSAYGQAIVLKDGITKLGPDQFKVENGKVMKIVKIGDKIGQSELQLTSVLRLEWPTPEELTQGKALIASGKADEGLAMLQKGKAFFELFKDIPGNHYTDLSFAVVEALGQTGKFEETIKAMPALRLLKLSDQQKMQLKIIQLNIDRQTSSDYNGIIAQAESILADTDDSAVGASLWILQGDVLLKKKEYEKALLAYLRVPVFFGTQVQRVPEAELAAAGCLAKMRRFEDAATYYKRLVDSYPGSAIAESAKTEEAKIRGLKNEDETPAKAGDKKADEADKPADAPKEEKK